MDEKDSKLTLSAELFNQLLSISHDDKGFSDFMEYKIPYLQHRIRKINSTELLDVHGNSLKDIRQKVLVIENVDVTERIRISVISSPLLIIDSVFNEIEVVGDNQNQKSPQPLVFLKNANAKSISLENCNINELYLDAESHIENFINSNCTFNSFEIKNSQINNISFSETIIYRTLRFLKSHSQQLTINNKSNLFFFLIENSCVNNISISGKIRLDTIKIGNSHIKNALSLRDDVKCVLFGITSNSRINYISIFENCHISEFIMSNIRLKHVALKNGCSIRNWIISKIVTLGIFSCYEDTRIFKLKIDSSFFNEFDVTSSILKDTVSIQTHFTKMSIKLTEIGDLILKDSSKVGDIVIEKCQISFLNMIECICSLFLIGSNVKLGYIDNSKFNKLEISKGSEFEIYLKKFQINCLSFSQTSLNKNSIMSLSEGSIYCIEMDEFTIHGDLHLRKVDPQDGCFDWWWEEPDEIRKKLPKGFFQIANSIRKNYIKDANELIARFNQSTIKFSHSTLGKTEFTNCKLADFRFEFNNSRITDCFISGGTIPSEKIVIIDDKGNELDQGNIETHSQKASIYNQFKKIFESQGDAYRAAQFQAKWAEHQKRYLQLEHQSEKTKNSWRNPLRELNHLFSDRAQDIGVFKLNKWSNNHGESWAQALGFTLLTTGIIYTIFLWTIGRIYFVDEFDWNLIGYYFEFLTPSFKPDFITGHRPSPGSIILYYLGKAVFAYGLYQFIAAFRKHGRKK
jgi:hypothetical protein